MPAIKNKSRLKLIIQPRISPRDYLYEYYAYIVDGSNQEDAFGKGGGLSLNKEIAKKKAIGEAIERYCGSHIDKKLTKKKFKDLINKGLNPQKVIFFHKNQYRKNFLYKLFHPSVPINWVEGVSLIKKKHVLVPAFAVYLGYNRLIKEEPVFIVTTSNGLASNKTINKATISAIFELVERDALMITWYAKRKVPRISIDHADSPELKYLYRRITKEGYHVEICVTTTDIPIPSVVAIIYDGQQKIPYASFGASTSYSIEMAALKALEEAILVKEVLETMNTQSKINKRSPLQVNNFMDHAVFYAQPKHKKIWSFLLRGPIYPPKKIEAIYNFPNCKKLSKLKNILEIFKRNKMEVIRVNLTNKAIKNTNFEVVKVIIPELQPIDVSYKARFLGGKRLYKFTRELRKINNYPHPIG